MKLSAITFFMVSNNYFLWTPEIVAICCDSFRYIPLSVTRFASYHKR